MLNPRKAKLLEELPKNNWKVEPSALKAGYSKSYARKQQKQILKSALKDQARELMETASNPASTSKEIKRELIEIIGLSRQDLYKRLKYIAFDQDKDLSSSIKILQAISKDSGIPLTDDDSQKTIVPILNIGVKTAQPSDIMEIDPASTDTHISEEN